MKKVVLPLIVLMVLIGLAQSVSAGSFRLEPGDPHWIREEDPANKLNDMGEYWQSNRVKGDPAPRIYFKVTEYGDKGGTMGFWYGKDIPRSWGWDKLQLFGSNDGKTYSRIWASPEWGYVSKRYVTVTIPAGNKYFYFSFNDGNLNWEILKLWKQIDYRTFGPPAPTPTPPPTTPPPTKPIPGFEAAMALAGLITLAYLLRRKEN